jgi:ABC-type multidrug transport system fused ATPase/permease subunit
MNIVHMIVIISGDFFVLGYGGFMVSRGAMGVGDVIAFLLLFERMFGPISYISTVWPSFQASLVAARRVLEISDLPEEAEAPESKAVPSSGDVSFRNVSFSYTGEKPVLNGISFTARKGEVTAIVGPSGAGKSTVLKLLTGLYTPEGGEITYGNGSCDDTSNNNVREINISSFKKEEWRSKFSYISQEPNLFSGTIRENILYGKAGADSSAVMKAAEYANITDLIGRLPEGCDTVIGERGSKLSGGERQRVSIARSVLADPEILVWMNLPRLLTMRMRER